MRTLLFLCALMMPFQTHASNFQRPIPNPQTATAEGWFLLASVALLLALAAVQWLVTRR
ncbi:hypothetical protein [Nisaea denitrificans]|uniref:hypothetical protein n=1 Tax=Nisaea denitrificans TaxID=390877 RepID=UPI00041203E1|nr:hypothetical protein [Nisaea denitrificans]